MNRIFYFQVVTAESSAFHKIQFVLFGFKAYLALQLGRSPRVLLQGDIGMFSESGSGWAQGTPRRQWHVLAKRCNTANDRFPACPKGATQMIQYGVTALDKDRAIVCGLCLVLDHLDSSEHVNITLKEYCSHSLSYDSAGDRPTCFASYTLKPESFVQYAG